MSLLTSIPALPMLGLTATDAETSPAQTQSALGDVLAGVEAAMGSPGNLANKLSQDTGGAFSLSGWFGARGITMILGLLLIAAALFSHPAVRETIVRTGKRIGEGAALAA